jgi:hypothetical protein
LFHADKTLATPTLHGNLPEPFRFRSELREAAMPDDLSQRGAQDRARINLNEPHEVKYWTQKFGVTADQLKAAVEKAGVSAQAVALLLGKPP